MTEPFIVISFIALKSVTKIVWKHLRAMIINISAHAQNEGFNLTE